MENREVDTYDNFRPIPVRRFFAKLLDITLLMGLIFKVFGTVFGVISGIVISVLPFSNNAINLYVFLLVVMLVCFYFAMMLEAFFISKFKRSLGKVLFKIWVTDSNGYNLSFATAWKRNQLIIKDGLGYLIPVYSLLKLYSFYDMQVKKTYEKGQASWDNETNSLVSHEKISIVPYLVVIYTFYIDFVLISAILDTFRQIVQ